MSSAKLTRVRTPNFVGGRAPDLWAVAFLPKAVIFMRSDCLGLLSADTQECRATKKFRHQSPFRHRLANAVNVAAYPFLSFAFQHEQECVGDAAIVMAHGQSLTFKTFGLSRCA